MAIESKYISRLALLLGPLGPVEARRMFGGWGFFCDGLMFALSDGKRFYIKTDAETRPRFESAGCKPFIYRRNGHPIAMSYFEAPEGSENDGVALREWAELGMTAARRGARRAGSKRKR